MWCAVRTRRSRFPGAVLSLFACLWLAVSACSFDPTGSANPGTGEDDSSGGGSDDDGVEDGGGNVDDAGPGMPDAGPVACEPGQTVCGADGRTLNVCNEAGDGYSQTVVCPFACEEDDHCSLASNLPQAVQEACDADAPPLTPPAGAVIEIVNDGNGRIDCQPHCGDGSTQFIDAAGAIDDDPQHLSHFCLSQLDIPPDVSVTAAPGLPRSVALFVAGTAVVAGTISIDGEAGSQTAAGRGGGGGGAGGELSDANGSSGQGNCPGLGGTRTDPPGINNDAGGGGGGGGYGAGGGIGGDGRAGNATVAPGGNAGGPCGETDLDPLIGGSGGGGGGDGSCGTCGWPGGGGGGALQISAIGGLTVSGRVSARGGNGFGSTDSELGRGGGGGGGAGGGILLESAALTIEGGALVVEGGAGGAALAGNGGGGGAGGTASGSEGADADADNEGGGGAGGSGGRVRINATVEPSCKGIASPELVCDSGRLRRGGGIGGQ